jgi:hypothetical protein
MNESSLTLTLVVFTAAIAFVVAKVAPALLKEEKECPPPQRSTFWRLLQGKMLIRREQVSEEWFEEVLPPKGK